MEPTNLLKEFGLAGSQLVLFAHPLLAEQADTQGYFPELCKAITARRKQQRSKAHLRFHLEAVRDHPSDPPLSMEQVARQLGVNPMTLQLHFPELYAEIVECRQEYWKQRAKARKETARKQILTAIKLVDDQNEYPSARKISAHLPKWSMLKESELASVWREGVSKLKDRKGRNNTTQ